MDLQGLSGEGGEVRPLRDRTEEWLLPQEAAWRLGVSRQYVNRLLRSGRLAGRRVAGWWQVSGKAVDEMLAERPARRAK